MNRKIHPIVAVVVLLVALVAISIAGYLMLGTPSGSSSRGFRLQPANPQDPHFRADPKLAGGGG